MSYNMLALGAALAAGLLAAGTALAGEPFDGVFFVRYGGAAAAMLQDREACTRQAFSLGGTALQYSDPNYGAVSAMGEALDSDALHEGGLHKRLARAVFVECMKRQGWIELDPDRDEAKALGRASLRHPEALDAWLKTHDPTEAPPPPPPPGSAMAPSNPPPVPASVDDEVFGGRKPH